MNQDLAMELANQHGDLRDDYSGRGMMGETTYGVVFEDMSDFYTAIADIIDYGTDTEREFLTDFLREGIRTDNMGHSIIIY